MWGVHMCAHAMAFEEIRGQFAVFSCLLPSFDDGTQVISFGGSDLTRWAISQGTSHFHNL